MHKKRYEQINETLYYERLDNGLKVYLLPKEGFHKTYGLFSTNYGSIDNHFGFKNQALHQVPDGIAHFLEHKMFEKEEGDVFQKIWATRCCSQRLYEFYENELSICGNQSYQGKSRYLA